MLAVTALAGCSNGAEEATPSPTGDALPDLTDVRGEERLAAPPVVNDFVLGTGGQPPPMDEGAVLAAARAVTDWLDSHLNALQEGDGGTLGEVATPGLLDAADPASLAAVTGALASRDDPVDRAVYDLTVPQDGAPQWVTAEVAVTRRSGRVATAVFTFAPASGTPQLVAFGPGAASQAAPPAASPAPAATP